MHASNADISTDESYDPMIMPIHIKDLAWIASARKQSLRVSMTECMPRVIFCSMPHRFALMYHKVKNRPVIESKRPRIHDDASASIDFKLRGRGGGDNTPASCAPSCEKGGGRNTLLKVAEFSIRCIRYSFITTRQHSIILKHSLLPCPSSLSFLYFLRSPHPSPSPSPFSPDLHLVIFATLFHVLCFSYAIPHLPAAPWNMEHGRATS